MYPDIEMRLSFIALFSTSVYAQILTVGVMGGVPLTDAMSTFRTIPGPIIPNLPPFNTCGECATERTVPYVVGPAAEVRLKWRFNLAVEALYSRVDYNHSAGSFAGFGPTAFPFFIGNLTATKHVVDRWEFPALLKYTIRTTHRLQPFVEAGISVQHNRDREAGGLVAMAFESTSVPLAITSLTPSRGSGVNSTNLWGPAAGIGATLRVRRLRPSLEFRFTRWNERAVRVGQPVSVSPTPPTALSAYNQTQLLLSFMF